MPRFWKQCAKLGKGTQCDTPQPSVALDVGVYRRRPKIAFPVTGGGLGCPNHCRVCVEGLGRGGLLIQRRPDMLGQARGRENGGGRVAVRFDGIFFPWQGYGGLIGVP